MFCSFCGKELYSCDPPNTHKCIYCNNIVQNSFSLKPHKCPVCDGSGKVSRPSYIAGDVSEWSCTSCGPYDCEACLGSGIVWC